MKSHEHQFHPTSVRWKPDAGDGWGGFIRKVRREDAAHQDRVSRQRRGINCHFGLIHKGTVGDHAALFSAAHQTTYDAALDAAFPGGLPALPARPCQAPPAQQQ